jgi:UDPglucose 6-dehydrogenase
LARGGQVRAYDPVASKEAQRALGERPGLSFPADAYQAAKGADAIAIVTEWREFRTPDWDRLKTEMHSPVMFDGRNLFAPEMVKKQGFEYFAIGRRGSAITQMAS